jgi:hypothetical protein
VGNNGSPLLPGLEGAIDLEGEMDESYRVRDNNYLNTVRGQQCLVHGCNKPGSAHHLKIVQPNAMSLRPGDQWVVPLCHTCHMDLHQSGMSEEMWWDLAGVRPIQWAEENYRRYLECQITK